MEIKIHIKKSVFREIITSLTVEVYSTLLFIPIALSIRGCSSRNVCVYFKDEISHRKIMLQIEVLIVTENL